MPAVRNPLPAKRLTVPVIAVLVSHQGARWLPEMLAALAAQTVLPLHAVGVDTHSSDGSAVLMRAALGDVLELPAGTTFAAAVAAGLAAAPASTWVWLLHDDAAPAADALERLLAADPGTVLRGPKVVDWDDPRILIEVGVSTDASGRRLTGVEPGEQDQGQHDEPRDVLAVGTAGALVRRDVWDAIGGLDVEIGMFADDLDLGRSVVGAGHRVGVVPGAVIRHARAATTGRRRTGTRAVAADRRARAYVRLAHARTAQLPVTIARLVVGALIAAAGLLLGRRPRLALDELAALRPFLRPDRLARARRRRRTTGAPDRSLLARGGSHWRLRARWPAVDPARRHGARPAQPHGARPAQRHGARPAQRHGALPGLALVAAVGVVTLVAERALLGGGVLAGGRLLPAPDSAAALLSAFAAGAPPDTGVLALLSLLLLGHAGTAVSLLVLGAVPLSAGTAWLAAGRITSRPALRCWAGATWALLPVATGGVAAGRLDALAVQVALPLLLV
ncbi:MAG: glycosyltransferase family 2 protein, partial [Frankiales bacterium]|nr:glycosyltransferase family 2 protein [Frankiales bacterium]